MAKTRTALQRSAGREALSALVALFAWLGPVLGGEVAIVTSSEAKPYEQARDAAREQLRKAGFSCKLYQLNELNHEALQKLKARAPVALLAVGSDAAAHLHRLFDGHAPLCYCMVGDPVSAGLTKGKVAVGVTTEVPLKMQFELVRQALPHTRRVGLLYNASSQKGRNLKAAAESALPDGWVLEAVAVEQHPSFSKAIEALLERKVDLVWTWPDASLYNAAGVRALLLSALRHGVPVYGFSRPFVRAGALLGMGVEPQSQGEQAAGVLRGLVGTPAVPKQAQVHAPQAKVIVNLVVAKRLSIKLPEKVVKEAAEVIQAR